MASRPRTGSPKGLTATARAALEWFERNGPVGWFGYSAPSSAMRSALIRQGLIEAAEGHLRQFAEVQYKISDKGREALQEARKGRP